jgi:hypothetical protein
VKRSRPAEYALVTLAFVGFWLIIFWPGILVRIANS